MSDQLIELTNRIVTALNKINTSIQKLGDYVTANSYALGTASVVEVVAVSAIEASTKIITTLISSVASAATTVGALRVATKLRSSADGLSAVADSILRGIWTNRGSAVGIVTADGTLRNTTGLLAVGSADGIVGADADLDVEMKLVGAISSQGLCGGMLEGIA